MSKDKPPLYSLRLWLAKRRRHLNQWILLKLFRCLERLTKRQLSLLSRRRALDPGKDSSRLQALRLNLLFPISLGCKGNQLEMLEDLQLLSRELISILSEKG